MATDLAPPTNGLYGTQYGQPAELAASTPSAPAHASSTSQSSTAASTTAGTKADPQEIGWYFVEQYYTNLSKSPDRIHLFYNKKSQLVTGDEAEKVVPAVGIKAISDKIKSMDIQDCKVRVLNVDSQASFQNIVVQVIGEMSNKSEPHRKFVQTFVLAEQPNGYFVLNDIFRYLNNDEDEIIEDVPTEEEVPVEEHSSPAVPAEEPEAEKATETVDNETAVEKVDTELEDVAQTQEDEPLTNGTESPAVEDDQTVHTTTELAEEPAEEPAAPVVEKPADPEPTRAPSPPIAQPLASAPATDAAPVRKTWASMVGTKAPAVPVVSIAAPAAAPSQPKTQKVSQPAQQATTQAVAAEAAGDSDSTQSNGWQMADHGKKQKGAQAVTATAGNTLAYIKNVTEKVDAFLLKETLEKYGKLKYFDVARARNCAFVEFETPQGYAATVAANPHEVGSETIYVEERRPKPAAYGGSNAAPARGGFTPAARGGRGGAVPGRSGSQGAAFNKDAPRGSFQPRGGKSGNVTPRGGRGQGQTV